MGSVVTTEVALCNLALREVVDDTTLTALTDANDAARKCNLYYAQARDEVLELHPWRFATIRKDLVMDGATADVSGETTAPASVAFRPNGRIMYVLGGTRVYQYPLTRAFDITSYEDSTASFDFSIEEATPTGVIFNPAGTKMYMVGTTDGLVEQYTLATPWDVSTATVDSVTLNVSTEDATPEGIVFGNSGLALYMVGNTGDALFQYVLTTAYDLSTASYDSKTVSVAVQDTNPVSMAISSDGLAVFVAGSAADAVHQYTLSTAWDISTATADGTDFQIDGDDTGVTGITLNADGTQLFLVGTENDKVFQFGMEAYTLSTANADKPISGYAYRFSTPADMISPIEYVHASTVPEPNWEEESGFFLTNETVFPLKYIKRETTVSRFSPLCTEAIILNLAAFLAVALKADRNLQGQLIARRTAVIGQAELIDARVGNPAQQDANEGWTDREGGNL